MSTDLPTPPTTISDISVPSVQRWIALSFIVVRAASQAGLLYAIKDVDFRFDMHAAARQHDPIHYSGMVFCALFSWVCAILGFCGAVIAFRQVQARDRGGIVSAVQITCCPYPAVVYVDILIQAVLGVKLQDAGGPTTSGRVPEAQDASPSTSMANGRAVHHCVLITCICRCATGENDGLPNWNGMNSVLRQQLWV